MIKKQLLFLVCSLIFLNLPLNADSLWSQSSAGSIFDNQRSFKVGDLVTVVISAESTAVQEAGTTTRKQSNIGANFFDTFDQYSLDTNNNKSNRKMQDYRIGGNDNYSGVGQTTRKSKVEATVSCVVTRILSNGNLVISGERLVDVNNDSEIIQISGIIRPADISAKNSIESYQIAQFNISLKGKGVVNSKQTPGFLSNFFNWVF
jgi:flagellar L-ring protein precursor FlgH